MWIHYFFSLTCDSLLMHLLVYIHKLHTLPAMFLHLYLCKYRTFTRMNHRKCDKLSIFYKIIRKTSKLL